MKKLMVGWLCALVVRYAALPTANAPAVINVRAVLDWKVIVTSPERVASAHRSPGARVILLQGFSAISTSRA
jgi:hypothetical protein